MGRLIQFFDRPCCGTSGAQALAEFLSERLTDQAEVQFHDLSAGGAARVSVPAALIAHLNATPPGALPVMFVDGRLVAAGALPNYLDAVEVARGRLAVPAGGLLPVTSAPGQGRDCC
jgi:hypothetical protein